MFMVKGIGALMILVTMRAILVPSKITVMSITMITSKTKASVCNSCSQDGEYEYHG